PDTLKIILHLQKLEKQAKKAGGHVHLLIGNHEYMNITGDLRYVHPGEYEAFETRNSKRIRDNYYAFVVQTLEQQRATLSADGRDVSHLPVIDEQFKKDWYAEHPPGFVEHRLAWQPGGELFEWVAAHNTVIRINATLFLHGGLSAELLPRSLTDINEQIRAEISREPYEGEKLGDAENGPLWYRGQARGDEATEREALQKVLAHYGAQTIVLGHTPDLHVITPRFDGQVIIIDTGISSAYGGHRASLLLDGNTATAIHGETAHRLPLSEDGMLPYFEELAELMPSNTGLTDHVENLKLLEQVREKNQPLGMSQKEN
ncbi:MAG: metallophosphoesterase, partial [Proteobacteria bacterium]|nr:metallophosphoesterase [Pseudomonadota bacterium]